MKGTALISGLAIVTSLVSGAIVPVRRQDVPVTEAAASVVVTDATLLPFETLQLTEDDITPLNDTLTALFGFDDVVVAEADTTADITTAKRATAQVCKTFPGDALWPATWIWDLFDILIGGALVKTIPIAAPCYPGSGYNAARCAVVVNNWTDSALQ